jgi:hypothetical protein
MDYITRHIYHLVTADFNQWTNDHLQLASNFFAKYPHHKAFRCGCFVKKIDA